MGIYTPKLVLEVKRKLAGQEEEDLSEHEDDNTDYTSNDDYVPEEDDDNVEEEQPEGDGETPEEDPEAGNDEGETPEEDPGEDTEETDEPNDYSIPDEEGEETPEGDDTEGGTQDTGEDTEPNDYTDIGGEEGSDDAGDNTGEEVPEEAPASDGGSELQELENQLFKDMTAEQITIKMMELKKQYLEVYNTILNIITRANKIPKTSDNIKILEFVVGKLTELKVLVYDYLTNTFETKTYIENSINYQEYIAILNTIDKIFKEIQISREKDAQ